jgi:mannose-6-phosphate isomerase-like protein (cupin superfamily)
MSSIEKKSFDAADEVRTLDKTTVEVLKYPSASVARFTFQPGWKWSECVGPKVGTESCQATHLGAVAAGTMHVVHNDGSTIDVGPGDSYSIPPGHDAWIVGDEPFVAFEFESADTYAKTD